MNMFMFSSFSSDHKDLRLSRDVHKMFTFTNVHEHVFTFSSQMCVRVVLKNSGVVVKVTLGKEMASVRTVSVGALECHKSVFGWC